MAEYRLHRGRAWQSLWLGIVVALLLFVLAVALSGAWAWVCLVAGLALVVATIQTIRMMLDKRPMLSISPEGLFYRPFAAATAPWSDITAIAHLANHTNSVWLGRVKWTRTPSSDQVNFAVANPSQYPNHIGRSITRTMQSLGGLPPIMIQLWLVDAAPEAILTEIAKHWRGEIAKIDLRPPV